MERPQRKQNRLTDFSYSRAGAYFITICAIEGQGIFSKILPGDIVTPPAVVLTHYGRIVEKYIIAIHETYPDVTVDKYVIMPNHIHMILSLRGDTLEKINDPANDRIPFLISTLKRFSNKEAGNKLWQRSYHDHVIRNSQDYQQHWKYIDENPLKWMEDDYYFPDI